MDERWQPVVDWADRYEVSDLGRVRSTLGRVLAQRVNGKGYAIVDLKGDGRRATARVHRLVLLAFVGPAPDGHVGCHGPAGQLENTLANLRWDTSSENSLDVARHGRHPQANRSQCLREHELAGPNLKPSTLAAGRRDCLSCARAHDVVRGALAAGRPVPDLRALADENFARIMAGVTGRYYRKVA